MKIGIDARMYGSAFTGIGRYNHELISRLAVLDAQHEYVIFLQQEGFDAFTPPGPRFRKVLANYPHYSLGEQTGFLRLLNAENLDLMHFTHFNAPLLYRRPYLVTIHDLTLSFFPGKKMTRFFHRWAYQLVIRNVTRHARRIIAVSGQTKKDLIRVLGVPEEKISVIYNGVNPEFAAEQGTPAAVLAGRFGIQKPYFLYTGVWRDHKNVVGLIRAFKILQEKTGSAYELVITGRPNPVYHEIPDSVKALGLENAVRLVGSVSDPDLIGLYKNALAYVFPSFYEGFGLPPLEAMQAGIPVAASNASAIPEICGSGNALFFNPNDPDEMAAKMKQIAEDDDLRKTLVSRGKERVRSFDWNVMATQVLELYNASPWIL